jgi:hypothetical protein
MKLSLITSTFAILAVATTGCASIPEAKTQANGEPLSVREKTENYTYQTQEKVGEVEHRTASGQKIGTSSVYVNQTHVGSYQVWSGYQGNAAVSDDDFYRIAKDKKADDEVKSERESGVTLNRVGLGILAAGIASVAGGWALRSSDPNASNTLSTIGVYGGGLLVPVGGVLAYLGLGKASSVHPLSQERAEAAASRYNKVLGSVGAPTSFSSGETSKR